MNYYKCDLCGKELAPEEIWILNLIPNNAFKPTQRLDLCSTCATGVKGLLSTMVKHEEETKE